MAKSIQKGRHSTKPQYSELGDSGLVQSSGVIREEFLSELRGSRGMKVYREMSENDPVIGAFLFAVEQICDRLSGRLCHSTNPQVRSTTRNLSILVGWT